MEKTTLYLPDELLRALRDAARRSGRPQAQLVREAIERYLADSERPRFRSFGSGEDAELDARDSEAWLQEEWGQR